MRIAFFTLNAYDMLTGGHEGDAVGGAQVQQILVGKELANRGHDVYFVEYDTGTKEEQTIDGIEVVTKPLPEGSELSRAITVARGTKHVLDRIEPDVCYRRSLDFEILPLSLYCSVAEPRFVYGLAHDDELTDDPNKFDTGFKSMEFYRWLNRRALSNAHAVIAQNPTQYDLAVDRLNTAVHQIPNCYESDEVEPLDWEFESPVVFWAARFDTWKRPDLVATLAEELADVTFVMAGGPGDEELFGEIQRRAADLENLVTLGHVPFSEIDRYFAAADIFLNTSEEEGFPNTFLQAWAQKTPVVSFRVDPNEILSSQGIGLVANGSIKALKRHIRQLALDKERRAELGNASRKYLRERHTVEAITDRYEDALFR
jgi:glycosyltransferase involved in cell wall biosynthesis